MEEEAEKMAALKRAYADIILNTAKESAARVLAAERRALGFQQSLFAAKEEALATMLRLKALMEEKIREAEKVAVSQAKKIEELELQLGEAEDTIVDLREDLKRVREELIMMKKGSVQLLSEGNINDACMVYNKIEKEASTNNSNEPENMPIIYDNITTICQKNTDTHQYCLQNVDKAEYPKEFSAEVDCPGSTDLSSIIWMSKVPELYRKGYTQRIHALEHNLTSNGPFGESNDFQAYSKIEPLSCASEKFQIPCKTDSSLSDKRTLCVKDVSMFEEIQQQPDYYKTVETGQELGCSGKDHFKFSSGIPHRKQRTMHNHSNVFYDDIFSDISKPCSSNSNFIVHDKWNESEAPKETSAPIQAETELGETTEDKKYLADISTEREILMLNRCRVDTPLMKEIAGVKLCTERLNCVRFQKQNQFVSEDTVLLNSLQNCENVKDLLLSRTVSKTSSHPSSVAIQEDLGDQIEVAVVWRAEVENITENSDSCNTVKPDTIDIANETGQTGTDKFLKYTFQRKRKKESSPIKNEVVFPEKRPALKPKSLDKQNPLPVPSKSSIETDLPRNNRRLVQVARQLISLSEKRW